MKKVTAWVIDDEIELGELFVDLFSSPECYVVHFNNPNEVINALKKESPDLFFIDYRMPKMDGDELAKFLPKNIPKYLITGEINPQVKSEFTEILQKPYKIEKVFQILESLISQNKESA